MFEINGLSIIIQCHCIEYKNMMKNIIYKYFNTRIRILPLVLYETSIISSIISIESTCLNSGLIEKIIQKCIQKCVRMYSKIFQKYIETCIY